MKTQILHLTIRPVLWSLLLSFATTVNAFEMSVTQSNVYYPNVLTYSFSGAGRPSGPGTLTVVAYTDLDLPTEFLTLGAEGVLTQDLFVTNGLQLVLVTNVVNLTKSQLAVLAADGNITFTITPSASVNNLGVPAWAELKLEYSSGLFDDFEPDIDLSMWAGFGGTVGTTVLATNYGGSVSPVNSLWFGDAGSRYARTPALDTTGGGTIQFYVRLADGFSSTWEQADNLPYEGVVLESSTNGTTWTIIGNYDTTDYYNWTRVMMPIPAVAQGTNVQFQWRQLSHSGVGYDHWALDDVEITPAVAVFAADFESGDNGFTFLPDPDATPNLWHRTTHRFFSPGNCEYYGVEGVWNYETGARNAGNLQSPAISLAGVVPPIKLSFNYLLQTETSISFDQAAVQISTDNGSTWTTLASRTGANALISGPGVTNFSTWTGDISTYAGSNIVLRFNFDTVDSVGNTYEGWYLDDVVINAAARRRILLIEDQGGFDGTANLLRGLGYVVAEVTNEFASAYADLLNSNFLNGFGLVVYGERGVGGSGSVLPASAAASLESYIERGGHVLVTGYDTLGSPADPNLANLVRSLNPADQVSGSGSWQVTNLNHFVLNGPFGDYRGQSFTATGYDDDHLQADTSRGAITLARTPSWSDRVIFTHAYPGGSVGYWNGGISGTGDAQPDFHDGGIPQNLFLNWAAGLLGQAPTILTQPTNLTVSAGGTATFSVKAAGTTPFSYFWQRNGSPIAGANASSYSTNNVQFADTGSQFTCVVSNLYGTVTSSNALLTVVFGNPANSVAYLRSTTEQPWGRTDNDVAMNKVFGSNWLDLRYETANTTSLFSDDTKFIFMEGSSMSAIEMGTFLTNNRTAISAWVARGGCLFLNAAPNEGGNIDFGFGVTLVYPAQTRTNWVAQPAHPIFNGPFVPVGPNFSAFYFAHSGISGLGMSVLLTNTENVLPTLTEKSYALGHVIFGGMTLPSFHSPQPQSTNLRLNILAYGAKLGHVPVTGTSALLIWDTKGTGTLALSNALANAGISVTLSDTDETSYTGANPSPAGFGAVIHLNGTTYETDMPMAGQLALRDYVAAGGGYIQNEWDAYEYLYGRMANMRDLILFDRAGSASGSLINTTVPAQTGHPVLFNVPASFTYQAAANAGPAHTFAVHPVTVLMRQGANDAVAVRQFGQGRVVGFSHSGNYDLSGPYNTLTNTNVLQLYINAVHWTAKQSPFSYIGIPAPQPSPDGTNEFTALRDTLTSLGFKVQVISQGQWSASSVVVSYPGCISSGFGPSLNDISNGVHFVQISDWGSDWTPNGAMGLTEGTKFAITIDAAHPITAGLPASWTTEGFWNYGFDGGDYAGWSSDAGLPSLASGGAPVNHSRLLVANSPGSGRAVYIGWNVYGPDATTFDVNLLRNAILWTGGVVIPQPPFINWHINPASGALELSWIDAGYHLQSQTNTLGVGLSDNWFDYPGGAVSPVIITPNRTNPAVFFRLVSP